MVLTPDCGMGESKGSVGIVGLGLIGSSIARAARRYGLARTIVAVDRDEAVRDRVRELGIADAVTGDPAEGAADTDLVILCVPVGAIGAAAAEMMPHLKAGAIVSDVGSVKGAVVAAIRPHLPEGVALVPGHPIAGTEFSGPDAGFATLFQGRWCILTTPEGTDPAAVETVLSSTSRSAASSVHTTLSEARSQLYRRRS